MRLGGKVSIITGGASGMGAAVTRRFAAEGSTVAICDLRQEEGETLAEALRAGGAAAAFHLLDVVEEQAWKDVVTAVLRRDGRIDVLVNSAGLSGSAFDSATDTSGWDALMAVNARGTFLGMTHTLPVIVRPGGAIVNFCSIVGNVGQPAGHWGYAASKGAVRLLSKAAAVQHAPDGVRVNTVHPGQMPPMRSAKPLSANKLAEIIQRIPMRRVGCVDEVASAVLFLASDEASYITGAELHVDGGYLAS